MTFELFPANQIANIVIHDHVIRLLVAKQTTSVIVQKFQERYLPIGLIKEGKIIDRDLFKLILEECVEDWGIKNRKVQFIIPDSFVVIRKQTIPNDVEDDEIIGYLYAEIGSTIQLPFEEPVLDFVNLSEQAEKKEILIFATSEEIAADFASIFEEVSLKPIAADISPLCMYRLFNHFDKTLENEHSLLVQLDLLLITLSIFHHDLPVFMRHLPLETTIADWDIKASYDGGKAHIQWNNPEFGIDSVLEEIVKEIEHILDFYRFSVMQGKDKVSQILVSGDHPYLQDVISILTERYEIPVITTVKSNVLNDDYNLALGLALKEVQ